jgi:biopolymer transport protein ExbD
MARKKSKFVEEVEDLNLVPIMNLVLCLIPLVLFKTQLVKIGMVNVSAPSIGPSQSKPTPDTDKKPLGLTVTLEKDGFALSAKGGNLFELLGMAQEGDQTEVKIKKVIQKYVDKQGQDTPKMDFDYLTLYKHLSALRDKYPNDPEDKDTPPEVLTLTAPPDMAFKHFIRVMDIVRFRFESSGVFKDIKDISEAAEKFKYKKIKVDGGESYEPMWDQVTFGPAKR